MIYLCDKYESIPKTMIGETKEKRSQVMRWLFWANSTFSLDSGRVWALYKDIGMRERKPIPADRLKEAEVLLQKGLTEFDKLLEGK